MATNSRFYYKIQKGTCKLIEEKIIKEVETEELLSQFTKNSLIITPILPKNCIYYSGQSVGKSIYVIEENPTIRKISYGNDDINSNRSKDIFSFGKVRNFTIQLPYIYFIHIVGNGGVIAYSHIFCSKKRITNESDLLCALPFPNIYSNTSTMRICTGEMRVAGETAKERIENFSSSFWNSSFNNDLPVVFPKSLFPYRDKPIELIFNYYSEKTEKLVDNTYTEKFENVLFSIGGLLETWEKLTENDPMAFIKPKSDIEFCPIESLSSIVNHLLDKSPIETDMNQIIAKVSKNFQVLASYKNYEGRIWEQSEEFKKTKKE